MAGSIVAQGELIPMIEIPAGNFYMGTLGEDENYDEAPMHKVYISKPFLSLIHIFTRLYFKDCYIDGTTDFIFGPSTALFEDCIIHSKRNSYVTAASTPKRCV